MECTVQYVEYVMKGAVCEFLNLEYKVCRVFLVYGAECEVQGAGHEV